jgi:hypothetical protein
LKIDSNPYWQHYGFVKITIDLPEPVIREIERRAAAEGVGINEIMIRLIEMGLEACGPIAGLVPSQ